MANVHADATPAAAGNNDATQQQTNVNSVETNQTVALSANTEAAQPAAAATSNATSDSQAIDVAIDHSALNNAVSGAQKAGLDTSEEPAKSNSTTLSNVDNAKKAIEQEEQGQATNIQNQTQAYLHDSANAAKVTSATQDHSALDEAVNAAKATPGITVKQDSDQNITVNPADDNAVNSAANDYSDRQIVKFKLNILVDRKTHKGL